MKKPQIRFRSFYAKLVIMFLFMGLIPFLLMGMLIYNVYSRCTKIFLEIFL
jgi:two-component system sensor histidine kinase YesM